MKKLVEYFFFTSVWQARPLVGEGNLNLIAAHGGCDFDRRTVGRIPRGILKHVDEDLFEQQAIDEY